MSFIWEKLLSTEAVPTGIERQMFARVLMLGNIVIRQHFVSDELCQLGTESPLVTSIGSFERFSTPFEYQGI